MHYIEVPKSQSWQGEEAIEALREFIKECEQQKGKELTNQQADSVIKLAKILISAIQTEVARGKSAKGMKSLGFMAKLKATIVKPESNLDLNPVLERD